MMRTTRTSRIATWVLPALLANLAVGSGRPDTESYVAELEAYRADREERLRAADGWLTVIGLFWLDEGENRFGSDPSNGIVLPADSAPAVAGSFLYDGTEVLLAAEPGAGVTLDGEPVTDGEIALETDVSKIGLGRLSLYPIARGGRAAIRAKDPENPARTGFRGIDFYPPDVAMRLQARLERHAEPEERQIPTVVGTTADLLALGRVVFELDGRRHSLEALVSEPDDAELFMIFKDATSGVDTYGAGRYLYAPRDGDRVVLDLNKAYNPPCAFTPYATCPLPPPGNRLQVPIEAGEKAYVGYP
jgi:uncharacterized protein (DUF1684 family)